MSYDVTYFLVGSGAQRRARLYCALFTAKRHRSRRVNRRHRARFLRRTRALALSFRGDALVAAVRSRHFGAVADVLYPYTDELNMLMRQHELEHWTGRRLRFKRSADTHEDHG